MTTLLAIESGAASRMVADKPKPRGMTRKQIAKMCRQYPAFRYSYFCTQRAKRHEQQNRRAMAAANGVNNAAQ